MSAVSKGRTKMSCNEVFDYILKQYGVKPDYPFKKDGRSAVFRHKENKKWFALCMTVQKGRLGLSDDGVMDIMNLKCEPAILGSLLNEVGVFKAYHMNKEHWLTVALDGSAETKLIKMLLDESFRLTK